MFVTALPETMDTAASSLASIGTTVAAGNAAGAPATTGVVPPAPEPASLLLALAFATHGGLYQATQGIGSVVHAMFVSTLAASAGSYAATEGLNAVAMV
jgi:PE family